MINMARWLDEQPDYQAAHVVLIDALREYIRANISIRDELIHEGGLTEEQVRKGDEHIAQCRALLEGMVDFEFDPSLCGLRKT
jgi:hypothetical protein